MYDHSMIKKVLKLLKNNNFLLITGFACVSWLAGAQANVLLSHVGDASHAAQKK